MPLSDEILHRLFHPAPKEAVEDVTLSGPQVGLGFPGEIFDLVCPECPTGKMQLRHSKFGLFYGCSAYPTCKASHGAHKDGRPMGIPGDKATRVARKFVHTVFDRLWKDEPGHPRVMTRQEAYEWVQKTLGLHEAEAHIGRFTEEQCRTLVAAVKKQYPVVLNAWDLISADEDLF